MCLKSIRTSWVLSVLPRGRFSPHPCICVILRSVLLPPLLACPVLLSPRPRPPAPSKRKPREAPRRTDAPTPKPKGGKTSCPDTASNAAPSPTSSTRARPRAAPRGDLRPGASRVPCSACPAPFKTPQLARPSLSPRCCHAHPPVPSPKPRQSPGPLFFIRPPCALSHVQSGCRALAFFLLLALRTLPP